MRVRVGSGPVSRVDFSGSEQHKNNLGTAQWDMIDTLVTPVFEF